MARWWQLGGIGMLMAVAVALGWALGFADAGLPVFWPGAGLLFGFLITTTRADWWRIILVAAVVQTLVDQFMAPGFLPLRSLLFSSANILNAYLGARIVLAFLNKPRRRSVAGEIMAYSAVAALIAPGISALPVALAMPLWSTTSGYFQVLLLWWSGGFLGITLIAPLIATIAMLPGVPLTSGRRETAECLLAMATLLAVAVVFLGPMASVLTGVIDAPKSVAALAILPAMAWLALRCDPRMVSGGGIVLFVIAVAYAAGGVGPFATSGQRWEAVYGELQLFFFIVCAASLVLSWSKYERKNVVDLLRARVGLGDLVVNMFDRFANTPFDDLDGVINESLRAVGYFAAADRVWLMRFDLSEDRLLVSHNWARPGITANADDLDGMSLEHVSWAVERLTRGEQLLLLTRDPPVGAEAEVKIMETAGTLVAGLVPLVAEDRVIGAMGVDWVRAERYWSDDIVALLYIVGQLFAGALRRHRNDAVVGRYQRRLRKLAMELALTEERTRRDTAVDLHDGIGQNLAVARIKLTMLEKDLGGDHKTLETLQELLDVAMQQTRSLVSGLSPSVLYELGLMPALRTLTNSMQDRWELDIVLREFGASRPLSEPVRLALYRVVRELLTNTVKHARASHARVAVSWREDAIDITVWDDGVGFSPPSPDNEVPEEGGFGLFSIRERILSQNGTIVIESDQGAGTLVRLSMPYGDRGAQEKEYDYDIVDS